MNMVRLPMTFENPKIHLLGHTLKGITHDSQPVRGEHFSAVLSHEDQVSL
jgi:hypothetical protein